MGSPMENEHENSQSSQEEQRGNSASDQVQATNPTSTQTLITDMNSNLPIQQDRTASAHLVDPERRNSLPAGVLEHHIHTNRLCGQILRYMGDDHFSKACGKHLRYMGDEMCLSYQIRNRLQESHNSSMSTSSSLPDLRREF
ncbi:hypothetical protein FSP39_003238 [Pinctada imbricata]|uniref:Uncharacterized protein n=1 Tax=Pinctada imbricata TaxID=66713 RepID=A0AA89C2E9_PINIB|nr:hypothetical protein FSP39_003238 [Pinctada imbricata]